MNGQQKALVAYTTAAGKSPFEEWLYDLRDRKAISVILTRLDRLANGNPGKCEFLGGGIFELKIFYGPGYRIYFVEEGQTIILLLCGGDKSTQAKDIWKAREYFEDYRRNKNEKLS